MITYFVAYRYVKIIDKEEYDFFNCKIWIKESVPNSADLKQLTSKLKLSESVDKLVLTCVSRL